MKFYNYPLGRRFHRIISLSKPFFWSPQKSIRLLLNQNSDWTQTTLNHLIKDENFLSGKASERGKLRKVCKSTWLACAFKHFYEWKKQQVCKSSHGTFFLSIFIKREKKGNRKFADKTICSFCHVKMFKGSRLIGGLSNIQ